MSIWVRREIEGEIGSGLNIPSFDGFRRPSAHPALNIPSFDGFFGHRRRPALNIPSFDGSATSGGGRSGKVTPQRADPGSNDPIQATNDAS